MSTVKKPILLDETGKEIVAHMRTQNALLSVLAHEAIGALTSWKDIQSIVRQGYAREIFHIGDQFIVPWKDVAANKSYDVLLDIVHFGDVELKDGDVVPAMFLQWHYATPFGVQFDAPENEIATGVFSADYSYYAANGENYRLLKPGTDYNIGNTIPTTATYYRSAIEDRSGSICKDGYNRWSHSAIRQFLNSQADVNKWWVAQHPGDMAPDQLTKKAGFMTGFEEDFLSCLNPIKVTTGFSGGTDDTYDTFFLPSLEQMYAAPQRPGVEGEYFKYWQRATGAARPNEWYDKGINPGYITYDIAAKTSPQGVCFRSAHAVYSSIVWCVFGTGRISTYRACTSNRYAPVCAIC